MADNNIAVINLGSQRVAGAVFGKTGGGDLILKRHAIVEMSGDPSVDAARLPQLKVAVEELAGKLRIGKSQVWCAVAGHTVFTRFVKLPPVQGDKLEQIVEFEARQNVPFPINEVIWDYEVISSEDAIEPEVVLVAIKADALNEINEQVEANGLKTSGVDLAPMALYNAFRYSYPDVDESAVIVDLGARSTNLVFAEEGRMFARNILVGGSSVTTQIGKEFGLVFGEAEDQKRAQGFVAFGGAVEEHADPAIAALSKVIRNSMTRLHSEVMRTVNYYRSQQGGSAPKRVFLAGGGAAMPGMLEFFQEKLKLPVEIFNPLRGVQMDRGADAGNDAPCLGECVGLALRGVGGCPVEVELVPDSVAVARDAAKRSPTLIMAGLCLFAALGTGIFYFKKADEAVRDKIGQIQGKHDELKGYATEIDELDEELTELKGKAAQIEEAVNDRSYWVRLLADLNERFENDVIWLTAIEPLKNGLSITPPLLPGAAADAAAQPAVNAQQPAGADAYKLRIQGLYRKNDQGQEVVYQYFNKLSKSDFIDLPEGAKIADYITADLGTEATRYAYKFKIELPLKNPMEFKK
jgi:type IV pilus assembly protein PilM